MKRSWLILAAHVQVFFTKVEGCLSRTEEERNSLSNHISESLKAEAETRDAQVKTKNVSVSATLENGIAETRETAELLPNSFAGILSRIRPLVPVADPEGCIHSKSAAVAASADSFELISQGWPFSLKKKRLRQAGEQQQGLSNPGWPFS